ncbi:hypothetical protein [Pseudopedobacter beijingensis]|uniref:PPIC-type PPIASE domain-containing protein n=1 Tax=Pseudopedobacter beijingensis TaxID=1207056 RepID=A0ABW4I9V6_9SPHI
MLKNITTITLLIFTAFVSTARATTPKPVAYINNQPIEAAELKREMLRYRSVIYSEYAATYNLAEVKDFWNKEFKGIKPIDLLRNRALKALTEIKVQQQLLEEQNLWPYKNYGELQTALQQENEQRQQKVQRQEIIYGPVVYTEQVFFDYKFSNALIPLKRYLTGTKIPVTDSLLLNHYTLLRKEGIYSERKTFNNLKKQVQDNYIEREYEKLVAAMVKEARVITIDSYHSLKI